MLGVGGEQIVLVQANPDTGRSQLRVVWIERDEDGPAHLVELRGAPDALRFMLDVSTGAAARAVTLTDVDEDGLTDLYVATRRRGLRLPDDDAAPAPFHLSDGRAGVRQNGPVSIPGLDVFGPGGAPGRPGGIPAATARFGFGTRRSASESETRTELL